MDEIETEGLVPGGESVTSKLGSCRGSIWAEIVGLKWW